MDLGWDCGGRSGMDNNIFVFDFISFFIRPLVYPSRTKSPILQLELLYLCQRIITWAVTLK